MYEWVRDRGWGWILDYLRIVSPLASFSTCMETCMGSLLNFRPPFITIHVSSWLFIIVAPTGLCARTWKRQNLNLKRKRLKNNYVIRTVSVRGEVWKIPYYYFSKNTRLSLLDGESVKDTSNNILWLCWLTFWFNYHAIYRLFELRGARRSVFICCCLFTNFEI